MEEELVNRAHNAGGSSEHGKSIDPPASNVSFSNECNGKIMQTKENEQLISSTSSGTQDMLESSQGVEHAIHPSTNTNAQANKRSIVPSRGKMFQIEFFYALSLEIFSLTEFVNQNPLHAISTIGIKS